jgi:predicted ATP-grasp superfamily ATP-dependent carboligase
MAMPQLIEPAPAARHLDLGPLPQHGERPPAVLLGDLNMLRCFVGSDVQVVLASSSADEVTLKSRHVKAKQLIAPFDETERVLADLEAIGRAHPSRPALFYGNDQQLLLISRNRDRLEPLFRFRMPSVDLIEKLVDKRQFATLADELSIPVPKTACSRDVASADEILAKIPLPYVIKPNVHIGWFKHKALQAEGPRKALRADTHEEFKQLYDEVKRHTEDFVVQQYIPGGEDLIYSFHAYMDKSGVSLAHFVGKKIRTFPREAGLSTYLELVKEPRVVALGLDVVKKLNLVGPVKIDLKKDPRTGRFYVLELNPRFNLWHYLGTVCGVNLPKLAYADLAGEPLDDRPHDYKTGVKWLSFGNDFRSFVRSYRPSGELTVSQWLSSFRGKKVYDVFAWDDPMPFVAGMLQYSKAALGKVVKKSR